MEAPEKVYFSSIEDGTHYYTEAIPFEREYIEYIRTDAFIEKACEWLKANYTEFLNSSRLGINIVELVENFKNDMKGK